MRAILLKSARNFNSLHFAREGLHLSPPGHKSLWVGAHLATRPRCRHLPSLASSVASCPAQNWGEHERLMKKMNENWATFQGGGKGGDSLFDCVCTFRGVFPCNRRAIPPTPRPSRYERDGARGSLLPKNTTLTAAVGCLGGKRAAPRSLVT